MKFRTHEVASLMFHLIKKWKFDSPLSGKAMPCKLGIYENLIVKCIPFASFPRKGK